MKTPVTKLLSVLLITATIAANTFAGDFLIRNGDRVVFLGDSITEQRLYTTYVEAYALTRYPQWKLWFRNVGWGGDTSWLRQRSHPDETRLFAADETTQQEMVEDSVRRGLERDVLPLKPTLVTVKFGMNDHSYQAFREDIFRAYVRSQSEIARILQAQGARVAFLTPQPIEDKRADPDKDVRNESLRMFSNGLKDVAAKTGATFIDQFDPYMSMLLRERASNPSGFVGGGDAVHPGPIGHTVMAWAILKGMGASALVSRVDVDFAMKALTAAERCRVEALNVSSGGVSFDRQDEALPMPIDEKATPALHLAPILEELDRYELRVTGLPKGTYELSIDGATVGQASDEQLQQGWNLAALAGPITKQAGVVLSLVFRKNNNYFNRWRNVQLYTFPDWAKTADAENRRKAELARLDEEIAKDEAEIDAARKPVAHHFALRPLTQ